MGIFLPIDPHNFQVLQTYMNVYKHILGDKIKISKSTIIPIRVFSILDWLCYIGYIISKPREIMQCVDAPIGIWLFKQVIEDYCLDKVSKRISSWKTKHLSFIA